MSSGRGPGLTASVVSAGLTWPYRGRFGAGPIDRPARP